MWTRLGSRQPVTPLKFAAGTVVMGTAIAGDLAGYYSTAHERSYFGILGLTAVVFGVVLGLLTKPIVALMSGVR